MRRRDRHTLALVSIACGSLAAHAAVVWSAFEFGGRVAVSDWLRLPGGDVERTEFADAAPALPPPPPEVQDDPLGVADGVGTAVADAAGEQPLRAKRGRQDQPLLGSAAPGPLRDGVKQPPAADLLREAEPPALPPSPSLGELAAATAPPVKPTPTPQTDSGAPVPPPPGTAADDSDRPPLPPTPPAAKSSAAAAASDPGPDAGNEVDLFAKDVSAEFRAGEVKARRGRKFTIRGLRQGLAAYTDLAYMARPVVIRLRLELDEGGTPLSVQVERSSGSRSLDEAVRKAFYRSWFEPDPKHAPGRGGEPFLFTMSFE